MQMIVDNFIEKYQPACYFDFQGINRYMDKVITQLSSHDIKPHENWCRHKRVNVVTTRCESMVSISTKSVNAVWSQHKHLVSNKTSWITCASLWVSILHREQLM